MDRLLAASALWLASLASLTACGGSSADGSDSSDGSDGSDEDTATDSSSDPPPDMLDADPCPCGPGETCVLTSTDGGCLIGCRELPPSCGDAPSCDPACVWDLCAEVSCHGEVTAAEFCLPDLRQDPGTTGWGCTQPFGPCNPWTSNCPEGEACRPQGLDGFDTASCEPPPPADAALIGQPCTRSGGVYDGADNCEAAATCWDVDPDTQLGTCVALCAGAPHDPQCPVGTTCAELDPMWASFCLPSCDPLNDTCTPGYACTIVDTGLVAATLACLPTSPAAANEGQACYAPDDCAPGLACAEVGLDAVPGCAGSRCCTPYCDVDAPDCPPATPTCTAALAPPQPGLEHVGVCRI